MLWSSRALATLAIAATLAACGQATDKAGAAGPTLQHRAGDLPDPDMVAAVSAAHSSTPIAMKFRLMGRPVVGVPLQVVVALIPAADVTISHIHASFQPGDGLQLQTERSLDIIDPTAGGMIEQELSVVPQQAGVLSLNANVVVDMGDGSLSRSYAIPLIASDKPADAHSP